MPENPVANIAPGDVIQVQLVDNDTISGTLVQFGGKVIRVMIGGNLAYIPWTAIVTITRDEPVVPA
jgi:hypothetical protein